MGQNARRLTAKSETILEMIANGHSYDQILAAELDRTFFDIFKAAEEALALLRDGPDRHGPAYSVAEIRERHPRAYEAWTEDEDAVLRRFVSEGVTVARIAGQLGRQRSAIRSRIIRLGLEGLLAPKERARFDRSLANDSGTGTSTV